MASYCTLPIALLLLLASLAIADDDLTRRQERVASKYAQLEALMLKMAQLEATQNPRRAALLNQVLTASKEKHTRLQLEQIAELLGKRQLSRAVKEQVDAEKSLVELLKLLQSEDRSERNKSEQERYKEYVKEVERMIRIQQSIQGQNEAEGDPERIAKEQEKLAERADDLAKKIKENEEPQTEPKEGEDPEGKSGEKDPGESKPGEQKPGETKPSEDKPGEKEPGESKPGEKEPGEQKPGESKPNEDKPGEPKPGEDKPGEQKPGESKPNESKPSEQQPGESQPGSDMPPQEGEQQPPQNQPPPNPVRERIEQAQQRMKAAQQKLQDSQRKESVAEQQQAREELEKAKAELEKILKQLREEEMERTLQALEGRFRKMLEMQLKVYEGTQKLAAISESGRTRELDVQAGRLGGDETKIALDAQRALQLLEEEGSSVAFPTTVELMIDDMQQTAERLNSGKVDSFTQGLEEDIIASLEELLLALEQAQKKLEEQKQQPQQGQPPQQGQQEQPLVDAIQELKMIKSLQLRVNKRTETYARMLSDADDPVGQAETKSLLEALDKLSDRQQQVFEIVREIVLGRNK